MTDLLDLPPSQLCGCGHWRSEHHAVYAPGDPACCPSSWLECLDPGCGCRGWAAKPRTPLHELLERARTAVARAPGVGDQADGGELAAPSAGRLERYVGPQG